MPLNYASVDQNASRYAEQANNWLAESRKATGKLRSLFEEACLDTEGLKKTIEQARQSKESTGRQMETATIRIPRRGDN